MTAVVFTDAGWVPIGGIATPGPGPDPTAPPAVIILSAIAESSTELRVSWLAPTWSGGTVSHYVIDVNGVEREGFWTSTTITINELAPGTTYTISVRAVSTDGLTGPTSSTSGTTQTEAPTSSFAAVWDDMIASRDWNVAWDTFNLHTGYTAAGYSYADLINMGGTIRSDFDGQVIEGRRGSALQIRHNNVTVRGCLFGPGNTYGFDTNPRYGWDGTGGVIEFCTFDGTIGSGVAVDKAAIIASADNANALTFRYCDLRGWSSGVLTQRGTVVEYCMTNNFYGSTSGPGAHVSSLNCTGPNVRFHRNLLTEGGSNLASIYFDVRPVHNVEITENLLTARLTDSGNLPSYLLFGGSGAYRTPATGIVVGGNYMGDTIGLDFQYGIESGFASIRWGQDGNVRTPNIDFLTGNPL